MSSPSQLMEKNGFGTQPVKSFKEAIQERMEEKRARDRLALEQSLLGTLKSAHLGNKSYNLDMQYVMRQRIQEYRESKRQAHQQFVRGQIPDEIVEDLEKLEQRNQRKLQQAALRSKVQEDPVERRVQMRQSQQSLLNQAMPPQLSLADDHTESSPQQPVVAINGATKQEKKAIALNNPAVNCQIFLKRRFPEVFREAHRHFFGLGTAGANGE